MSQPQRETVTVSEFLQSAQEARAKHAPGTVLCYEHLKITNDNDHATEEKLLDLRGLHLRNVDFDGLDATGALCEGSVAYRCDFSRSNWSGAQGSFQIYGSPVSGANFTGAEGFSFSDAYQTYPAIGLTDQQAQSITTVSVETRLLLDTCDHDHFKHTIEEQKRISGLEATVAALAAQVAQLTRQRQ